jgi:hypothetical protein
LLQGCNLVAKAGDVLVELERALRPQALHRQQRVGVLGDALDHRGQLRRRRGVAAAAKPGRQKFVGEFLDLGIAGIDEGHRLAQRRQAGLLAEHAGGVLGGLLPGAGRRSQHRPQGGGRGRDRQSFGVATAGQRRRVGGHAIAGRAQFLEGRAVALERERRRLGDLLGKRARLTRGRHQNIAIALLSQFKQRGDRGDGERHTKRDAEQAQLPADRRVAAGWRGHRRRSSTLREVESGAAGLANGRQFER